MFRMGLYIRFIIFVILLPVILSAREKHNIDKSFTTQQIDYQIPFCMSIHTIGKLSLNISNWGNIGLTPFNSGDLPDCITGNAILNGSEYPKSSHRKYFNKIGLWVGGIVNNDTLVTTVINERNINETIQNWINGKPIDSRSILDSDDLLYNNPVSEQDYLVSYTDTFVDKRNSYLYDYLDHCYHSPL